ncbi:hypothetical protein Glove_176g24 [Diversispora epigaea]|uniref:Uncharacterized protein n=1 Tax=Diversispora epigaea TaxID=1348612 RepID=A0A397INM3_9GLOM|nr:hypothetical protein Glove_176g24 [Diversispora epigaea]
MTFKLFDLISNEIIEISSGLWYGELADKGSLITLNTVAYWGSVLKKLRKWMISMLFKSVHAGNINVYSYENGIVVGVNKDEKEVYEGR